MCGEGPQMAERVFQHTDPAAIGLILDGSQKLCPGGCRLINQRIDIVDIDENINRCASNRLRTAKINLWKLVSEHDRGVAYSKFSMPDLSVRLTYLDHLSRSKRLFIKLNGSRGVRDAQVRRRTAI